MLNLSPSHQLYALKEKPRAIAEGSFAFFIASGSFEEEHNAKAQRRHYLKP
jgi:hypothetical protein